MIVNGTKIAERILQQTKLKVDRLRRRGVTPHLAIILVGTDPASVTYTRKKQEAARRVGIKCTLTHLLTSLTSFQVAKQVKKIQTKKLSGVIVQLPLPRQYDSKQILNSIRPDLDIDLMTYITWGQLASAENRLEPPTPAAIMEILRWHKIALAGKHVVVVGRGWLIGKPMANLLMQQPVTLTVCGQETKNLARYTKQADIVISAVGKRNLIRGSMIKTGAVVIDAGFTVYQGRPCGDVNVAEVAKKAHLVTPTPGGVGPITVAKLLANTAANAEYLFNQSQ